ncbi:3-hydroxyacyl-ACP dehydratase FabZ family protein [Streptomyces sp. NBC_00059]|uniref:3-hydroxyacyl-ACP dehydratase FabZ family protein n=1 Tax=Streptomyces sp. NBC_00059 TaxID=2975635 RepID=UPI0022572016|nr:beta-hydroxyacyl-ACP dehydratase [Streptomyces sp. NBC_00059]MCX5415794.1 beta-hydroxyacyl-ACP dehydratase [Streptomyces sp. NBC_00059]
MSGRELIEKLLPHRPPMLLVDELAEVVPSERLTARMTVTGREPCFAGSDPQGPFPPVLLIESWCQAAGVLVTWDSPNPDVLTGDVMLFGGMTGLRILAPVRPGDTVEHEVRAVRLFGDSAVVEGRSTVGGATVMTVGSVIMARRPAQELQRPDADPVTQEEA